MFLTQVRRALGQLVAVLLALAVCGGTIDWGHGGWDDPGCDPVPVQHDHSAHRLRSGTRGTDAPADHCALCHLLRLFHTALCCEPLAATVTVPAGAQGPFEGTFVAALASFSLPSRAPPALA